jgi:type II secretory pathway component PulK
MQNAPVRTVFGEITDFLATNPTPEEIIAYRLPDDLQVRAHELLNLNSEDELTPEEHNEMLDFVRVDQMMSMLKIKMRIKLKNADE